MLNIKCITWNMGNKPAIPAAVKHYTGDLTGADVIAVATQEELAGNKDLFYKKILEQLNKDEKEEKQYELAKYESHRTSAGGKVSSDNRVSVAVLVKKPYKMEDISTKIIYDESSSKALGIVGNNNKSTITINGKIIDEQNKKTLPIEITGVHLDSFSEANRREHTEKFLQSNEKLGDSTLENIYKQAQTFSVIMGDFNERYYLMRDNSMQDPRAGLLFTEYGYDLTKTPKTYWKQQVKSNSSVDGDLSSEEGLTDSEPETPKSPKINNSSLVGKDLDGTYGFSFDSSNQDVLTNIPDKRKRGHNAARGHLDLIGQLSGIPVNQEVKGFYDVPVSNDALSEKVKVKKNETRKDLRNFGSDHLGIVREFNVAMEFANDPNKKAEIVVNYLKHQLPNFDHELSELKEVKEKIEKIENSGVEYSDPEMQKILKSLCFYDDKLPAELAFNIAIGAHRDCSTSQGALFAINLKIRQLEVFKDQQNIINVKLDNIAKEDPQLKNKDNIDMITDLHKNLISSLQSKEKEFKELANLKKEQEIKDAKIQIIVKPTSLRQKLSKLWLTIKTKIFFKSSADLAKKELARIEADHKKFIDDQKDKKREKIVNTEYAYREGTEDIKFKRGKILEDFSSAKLKSISSYKEEPARILCRKNTKSKESLPVSPSSGLSCSNDSLGKPGLLRK